MDCLDEKRKKNSQTNGIKGKRVREWEGIEEERDTKGGREYHTNVYPRDIDARRLLEIRKGNRWKDASMIKVRT